MVKQNIKSPGSKNNMSRRGFIRLSGTASIAVMATPMISCNPAGRNTEEHAVFQNNTLPVIHTCDVIVVGGSFAGVRAALNFAGKGKKVVLVEQRIYLGREITSTCRPWIDVDPDTDLPELVQACVEEIINQPFSNQRLVRFDHVKLTLENLLLENNVQIVYASIPVQLIVEENMTQGLVIGNKSGRQVILSKMIVDCTETSSVAHLTKDAFQEPAPGNRIFIRTMEFTQVEPVKTGYLDVPADLKMADNRIRIQRGYINENHYYVECPMVYDHPGFDPLSASRRESDAWEKSVGVAKYLYEEVPEFKNAFLANSSYQLHGIHTGLLQPLPAEISEDIPKSIISAGKLQFENTDILTGYKNLFIINEAARISPEQLKYLMTPQGSCFAGEAVSTYILDYWQDLAAGSFLTTNLSENTAEGNRKTMIREKFSPQRGRDYPRIHVDNQPVPLLEEVDILVAGGGSSGAPAAYVAAEQGKKTMVIDMNPGFGGTGTYAGVFDYWGNGRYSGFTARHIRNMKEIHEFIPNHLENPVYNQGWLETFVTWNIQGKMYMWLREIKKAGAQILFNSVVIGTVMENKTITGVVVATPRGVHIIKSKIVIDATGDGDVAGFAGAPFFYGSSRDHVPMWYALCKQFHPGVTTTGFMNLVDLTNIHDYTRAVQTGLRVGQDAHDHSTYLSTRESRHIQGAVTLTLSDNLTYRHWDDVINVHSSNCDMKGYHASDWQRIGLIPPNLDVEVPYRAILPTDIENILVVGKAFSANHESFAQIRMQHDLENLGGIAALAASDAIDDHVSPRNIDIRKLQKKLIELDLIPSDATDRQIRDRDYTEKEISDLVDRFNPDKPLHTFSYMPMTETRYEPIPFVEVCTSPIEKAIPVLEKKLMESSGKQALRIAQALAMLGSGSGAEVLLKGIRDELSRWDELPMMEDEVMHAGDALRAPPDQGMMPLCANLIYALGMTSSELNIQAWELITERFRADDLVDFYMRDKSLFNYVDAVCYSAGILGSRAAIPFLNRLHSNRFLNGNSVKSDSAGEYISTIESEYVVERLALMELIIARALARSGSTDGLEVMVEYLDDSRAILTEFAHWTLIKVTGEDYSKVKQQWNDWIDAQFSEWRPLPVGERRDG